MQAYVQKWGNSLALRIPKPLALEANITEGSVVELAVQGETLCVTPVTPRKYSLEDLLARVTPENLHGEISTGRAVGDEIW